MQQHKKSGPLNAKLWGGENIVGSSSGPINIAQGKCATQILLANLAYRKKNPIELIKAAPGP